MVVLLELEMLLGTLDHLLENFKSLKLLWRRRTMIIKAL